MVLLNRGAFLAASRIVVRLIGGAFLMDLRTVVPLMGRAFFAGAFFPAFLTGDLVADCLAPAFCTPFTFRDRFVVDISQ